MKVRILSTLYIILTMFLLFTPANGDILISKDAKDTKVITKMYNRMPSEWYSKLLVHVNEVDKPSLDDILKKHDIIPCDDIEAVYTNIDYTITIKNGAQDVDWVFLHEYGHFAWSRKLSIPDRYRFATLWRDRLDGKGLVSKYAETDVCEGFAEEFAAYMASHELMRDIDPEIGKYFDGIELRLRKDEQKKANNTRK